MGKKKYYKCNVCGNIIEKVHDSGLTPMCCMRDMEEMVPENNEALETSHKPISDKHKRKCIVCVGENFHPMDENHYIEWIEIVTNRGIHRRYLHPGFEPIVTFRVGKNEKILEIYAYCNRHNLWKSDFDENTEGEYDRYTDD